VPADGVCAVAETELACVDGSGKPRALPGWLVGGKSFPGKDSE
jgi:acyl-CoA thioesterase FadM